MKGIKMEELDDNQLRTLRDVLATQATVARLLNVQPRSDATIVAGLWLAGMAPDVVEALRDVVVSLAEMLRNHEDMSPTTVNRMRAELVWLGSLAVEPAENTVAQGEVVVALVNLALVMADEIDDLISSVEGEGVLAKMAEIYEDGALGAEEELAARAADAA